MQRFYVTVVLQRKNATHAHAAQTKYTYANTYKQAHKQAARFAQLVQRKNSGMYAYVLHVLQL